MDIDEKNGIETRCGYVAMIGRPNVGKSTLVNRIIGHKLSIVTAKPQTTRNRIICVHNADNVQMIFLDTPGLHHPRGPLGRYMIEAAQSAIKDADLCAWIIDVSEPKRPSGLTDFEKEIGEQIGQTSSPVLILLNKIDLVRDKKQLLPLTEAAAALKGVLEVIPISAKEGDGVEIFCAELTKGLPLAPKLYPEDMLSEQAERFFVAEIIRETLTELTRQEVPYSSTVLIEKYVEETRRCVIHAAIHVERASQRKIVVGRKGSMIKEIGQRSREAAQQFLGCPVDLRLHVNVSPGWTRSRGSLKEMGYE